jgi:transcription initiation factor TFIIB
MRCTECGSKDIRVMGHESVCQNCGAVYDSDPVAEYIPETQKGMAQIPELARAGTKYQSKYFRDVFFETQREKNIRTICRDIDIWCSKLKIPEQAVREAKNLFARAVNRDLAIGSGLLCLALASMYAVCIQQDSPRTPQELELVSKISKAKIMRAFSRLQASFALKLSLNAEDLILPFGNRLKLKNDTIAIALKFYKQIDKKPFAYGKNASTLAAVCLYLASLTNDDRVTQRTIANRIGVIEITLRKRTKELSSELFDRRS